MTNAGKGMEREEPVSVVGKVQIGPASTEVSLEFS